MSDVDEIRPSLSDLSHHSRSRRPSRRQSISSDHRPRAFSHTSANERKVSVLDDASSDGRSRSATAPREDLRKRLELNKGVRDMHFEL